RHAHDVVASLVQREGVNNQSPPLSGAVEIGYRRLEGELALVGVTTIVSGSANAGADSMSPPVAVSAAFLSNGLLAKLALGLGTDDLAVHSVAPSGGELVIEIPLGVGAQSAWLAWSPRTPGMAMLIRLLPALIAVIALLGAITILVLLYVRRTAERLNHS